MGVSMPTASGFKQVSIVLAAFNALEYTRTCLESIIKYTSVPYELILVNNGSSDGTKEHFETIPGAHLIHNETNLGFSRGYNQGIKASSGKYVVLINNDCIVSSNWLENMLSCAASDPAIGLVGPRGNRINGPQRLERQFNSMSEFHRFARDFNRPDPQRWFEVKNIVGFCLLVKREVVEEIGHFDESYGLGTHEDRDYALRARQAGFKLYCAGDVIVYHFSHRTFVANNLDLQKIYARNKFLFNQKWSLYKANPLDIPR
jgi:GT2 family glycosyltransferase